MLAQNDGLRALEVLIQRLKALEVAQLQGHWSQASQLELVMTREQTSVFRQELKAAQAKVKADWDLQREFRRTSWKPSHWYESTDKAEVSKEGTDAPPDNTPKGHGKKGKGWQGERQVAEAMGKEACIIDGKLLPELKDAFPSLYDDSPSSDLENILAICTSPELEKLVLFSLELIDSPAGRAKSPATSSTTPMLAPRTFWSWLQRA